MLSDLKNRKEFFPMKKILLLAAILALAFSCTHQNSAKEPASTDNSAVLAKVGDKAITKAMFESELDALPEQVRGYFMKQGGPRAFLDQIIRKEVLYQEALKEGLDKDKDLQAAVKNYKKITMVKLLLQKKIGKDLSVSDDEAQKYYDSHKDAFTMKEGKAAGKLVPFSAIKPLIKQRLASEKEAKAFTDYVSELKKGTKVDVNDKAVQQLSEDVPAAANTPAAAMQPSGVPAAK
ncbi:MAG: peptidylprolyl isomerase [Nitrospiraceae bacterium]|nr:peptidylprolyl isomerase [Nitrospiraceae bacterium]